MHRNMLVCFITRAQRA